MFESLFIFLTQAPFFGGVIVGALTIIVPMAIMIFVEWLYKKYQDHVAYKKQAAYALARRRGPHGKRRVKEFSEWYTPAPFDKRSN